MIPTSTLFCKKCSNSFNGKQTQTSKTNLCNTATSACFPIESPEKTCNIGKPLGNVCKIMEITNPNDLQSLTVINVDEFSEKIKGSTELNQLLPDQSECDNEVTLPEKRSSSSHFHINCDDKLKDKDSSNINTYFENKKTMADCNVHQFLDTELGKLKSIMLETCNVTQCSENKYLKNKCPENCLENKYGGESTEFKYSNKIIPDYKFPEHKDPENITPEYKCPEKKCLENEYSGNKYRIYNNTDSKEEEKHTVFEQGQENYCFGKCPKNKCPEKKFMENKCSEYQCPENKIPEYKCPENKCPENIYPENKCTDSKKVKETHTIFERRQENDCSDDCPQNKCPEVKCSKGKTIEYKCPEENFIENRCPEHKCHENKILEYKCPEKKSPDSIYLVNNCSGKCSENKCPEDKILSEVKITEYNCPEKKSKANICPEYKCTEKIVLDSTYLDNNCTNSKEVKEQHTAFERRQENDYSGTEIKCLEYKPLEYKCPENKIPEHKCPEKKSLDCTYQDNKCTDSKEINEKHAEFEHNQDNYCSDKITQDIQTLPPPIKECEIYEVIKRRKTINPYENPNLDSPHSSLESCPTKSYKLSSIKKNTSSSVEKGIGNILPKYPDEKSTFTVTEKECSEESVIHNCLNSSSPSFNIFKTTVQGYISLVYEKTRDTVFTVASRGCKQLDYEEKINFNEECEKTKSCPKPCNFTQELSFDNNLKSSRDKIKETVDIFDDRSKLESNLTCNTRKSIEDTLKDIVAAKFDRSSKYDTPIQHLPEHDTLHFYDFFGNIRSKFFSFFHENDNKSDSDGSRG